MANSYGHPSTFVPELGADENPPAHGSFTLVNVLKIAPSTCPFFIKIPLSKRKANITLQKSSIFQHEAILACCNVYHKMWQILPFLTISLDSSIGLHPPWP